MRIVKNSIHIKEEYAVCRHCGATIGYYPADLQSKHISEFVFKYFKCPVCGEPVVLKKELKEN